MGTVKLFKLFLGRKANGFPFLVRRRANGATPCDELPILSPLRGEVQAHFSLSLWFLSNRFAWLTFVYFLSQCSWVPHSFPLPTEH